LRLYQVIHTFINKVIVHKENVEIFINLIPLTLLGGIDLNIDLNDVASNKGLKGKENTENNEKDIEKDGFEPSSSEDNIHREKLIGAPSGDRTQDTRIKS